MVIKELGIGDAAEIYRKHLKKDFPPDERRPLFIMKRKMREGSYIFLGIYEDNALCSYATLFRSKCGALMIEYFAVLEGMRGRGIGSRALRAVTDKYAGGCTVFIEADDPESETDDDGRRTALRRIEFYRRNGFTETDIRSHLFGVDYVILKAGGTDDGAALAAVLGQLYLELMGRKIMDAELRLYRV